MLTGYGDKDLAIEAIRCGAFRYIFKPHHFEELVATIFQAYELSHLRKENVHLADEREKLRAGILKLLLISGIALISILIIALLMHDIFVPSVIAFIAILLVLFVGWQGVGKVLLSWGKTKRVFYWMSRLLLQLPYVEARNKSRAHRDTV